MTRIKQLIEKLVEQIKVKDQMSFEILGVMINAEFATQSRTRMCYFSVYLLFNSFEFLGAKVIVTWFSVLIRQVKTGNLL